METTITQAEAAAVRNLITAPASPATLVAWCYDYNPSTEEAQNIHGVTVDKQSVGNYIFNLDTPLAETEHMFISAFDTYGNKVIVSPYVMNASQGGVLICDLSGVDADTRIQFMIYSIPNV